jgi:hypothetical protein
LIGGSYVGYQEYISFPFNRLYFSGGETKLYKVITEVVLEETNDGSSEKLVIDEDRDGTVLKGRQIEHQQIEDNEENEENVFSFQENKILSLLDNLSDKEEDNKDPHNRKQIEEALPLVPQKEDNNKISNDTDSSSCRSSRSTSFDMNLISLQTSGY